MDAAVETAPLVSDIFRRMLQGRYDVAELGLTYFLRTFDLEDAPFMALPIFPNRNFRHSAIFVNTAAGIEKPEDLAGKTIGEFALFGHDAGVWPKGILSDEYGVTVDQCRWVIGGTDHPIPAFGWIPQPRPAGVSVRHAADDQTLGAMLESGEIDALISVDVPQALLNGSTKIARLFPDYEAAERDYYRRTGIFPPMHIVAVRKDLVGQTDLLQAVYRAFLKAKDLAERKYLADAPKQHMSLVTPWFSSLFEANRRLLGEDWWPYGLGANRKAIDTFLRYHHEQGLSKRLLTSEDIFVPEFLGT
ncbi:4,5-dihydroxyphthalate decarboxylase [Catenulispora sp. NF23]|uniref:4,5-dihydroxyphthalate decarboxylase n=1 Tax=Catenulispora pinistramenti TaxID=2705254 RepID=A0ABS5KKY1_9ACTN|nr:4,5-dihydroxyphthalate decarboxylase [Catenulispora pinistramenti]MBS2546689.1 4,5-dihydroxyphthalate decarboxylase [Catenulispora pinistramenti]